MRRIRRRGRWLGILGLATLSVAVGLWYARARSTADPIARGLAASSSGDWEEAARLARDRLKVAGDDPSGIRLIAQASAKWVVIPPLYPCSSSWIKGHVGRGSLSPGPRFDARRQRPHRAEVWELARAADPNHTDTLLALTRAYLASKKLAAAAETGQLLVSRPGWAARGNRLLGAIQFELNDPIGAIGFWQRSLELVQVEHDNAPSSTVLHKELARALLQVRRPAEARDHLKIVLAERSARDPLAHQPYIPTGRVDQQSPGRLDAVRVVPR